MIRKSPTRKLLSIFITAVLMLTIVPAFTQTALASQTVNPTASNVLVNGKSRSFEAYLIDGSNYFKLRDLATVLNGTNKQFSVGWDGAANAVTLTSGQPYVSVGGEMTPGNGKPKTATLSPAAILLDGIRLDITAYNLGGNNYFKLRDIMSAIDVYVGWDGATNTITIDTNKGYEQSGALVYGNTAGNIVNGGFAAQSGDWIYYRVHSNFRENAILFNGLYKIQASGGTDGTKLSNDSDIYGINVVGVWIYYSAYTDNESGRAIYKIRTDGTGKVKLSDDSSIHINVVGDWIYYRNDSDGGKLYKMRTDGTGRVKLNDEFSLNINVVGDLIYYIGYAEVNVDYAFYRIRTDGTGRLGMPRITGECINVVGDWIYFSGNGRKSGIYKVRRTEGKDVIKLSDHPAGWMNVAGDWIYFNNGFGIYKIRTDGMGGEVRVSGYTCEYLHVAGDWLYFQSSNDRGDGRVFCRIPTVGSDIEREIINLID